MKGSSNTKNLGSEERQILNILQQDSRISNQELAQRVNLSPSACWRRVQALEKRGVIRG